RSVIALKALQSSESFTEQSYVTGARSAENDVLRYQRCPPNASAIGPCVYRLCAVVNLQVVHDHIGQPELIRNPVRQYIVSIVHARIGAYVHCIVSALLV